MNETDRGQPAPLVLLSTGVEVRSRFEWSMPIGTVGTVSLTLDCSSGDPALVGFHIDAAPGHPIPNREVTLGDVRRFIDHALQVEAERVKLRQLRETAPMVASPSFVAMFPAFADVPGLEVVEELDDVGRLAVRASRDSRHPGGRPPIPNDTKIAIAEAYKAHGIDEARRLSGAGERWTRELVRQGKKLLADEKGTH